MAEFSSPEVAALLTEIRHRIADPGAFLDRALLAGRDPSDAEQESISNWSARAVLLMLMRPDEGAVHFHGITPESACTIVHGRTTK